MTGYLQDWDGTVRQLPELCGWDLRRTSGTPCDSFTVRFAGLPEHAAQLKNAVRFWAEADGQRVFTGVVDDYEIRLDADGRMTAVHGRGMGALLLDNEAGTTDFLQAQLGDILARFVTPFGIALGAHIDPGALWSYRVDSGESCYMALYGFCRWTANITPRFDAQGRLVLLPDGGGARRTLRAEQVLEAAFTEKRYGVITEVVENDKSTGRVRTVRDEERIREGGSCRRVMSVYSRTPYRASGRSAESVMALSGIDRRVLEVTVPGAFCAEPGDVVTAELPLLGIGGQFVVEECRSVLDRSGMRCTITMRTW